MKVLCFVINACTDKKNSYAVKVSGVEITPYPIERGVDTTFTISASTGTILLLLYKMLTC